MNKPPSIKSGDVIPIKPPPFFRALGRFIVNADEILQRYDDMQRLYRVLNDDKPIDVAACKRTAALTEYDEERLARCREGLEQFDPPSAYEDNNREFGDLRQSVIAEQIALLIDSKPTGRPSNPEVYATMMMEDLLAVANLSLIALTTACREVRQAKPYVPDISDLLPVLRQHLAQWDKRFWAIFNLADESRRLMAWIDELEIEQNAEAKARAEQQQAAAKARAIEQARHKLEKARRAAIDAEDVYCEASTALQESEEALAEAKQRVLECENELAQAEAAAHSEQNAE